METNAANPLHRATANIRHRTNETKRKSIMTIHSGPFGTTTEMAKATRGTGIGAQQWVFLFFETA